MRRPHAVAVIRACTRARKKSIRDVREYFLLLGVSSFHTELLRTFLLDYLPSKADFLSGYDAG